MKRGSPLQRRTPLSSGRKLQAKKRLNKSLEDLLKVGTVQRGSTFVAKPKPMRKRAKNNPGWVGIAKKMWDQDESLHYCEVTGEYLGDTFSPAFVHHILHRGSYRKFARRPDNFAWVSYNTHTKAHEFGIEQMAEEGIEHAPGWHRLNLRLQALREEAHGLCEEPATPKKKKS